MLLVQSVRLQEIDDGKSSKASKTRHTGHLERSRAQRHSSCEALTRLDSKWNAMSSE